MIEHDNIFYIRDISVIGGVETFVFELAKKYQNYDIAVVYKTADERQLNRLKQYCVCYQHFNQRIKCKTAIINWDTSIIDFIEEGADIYQTIHGDYENPVYTWKPLTHPRIKNYIGITKHIVESFKRITGLHNIILSYNPLEIEEEEKLLILVSATRLSKIKGKSRMELLARALDNAGIKYIWYVFTNDLNAINNPHVVYMTPRLDVGRWISKADYVVQLSDTEACSYTINEALYRNIPVIVTPLPYLEEIGVKDGINAWVLDFDCSNLQHIVDNIEKAPKFKFKHLEDRYDELLSHAPSHFKEDKITMVKVEALDTYEKYNVTDAGLGRVPKSGEQFEVTKERLNVLLGNNDSGRVYVKVVEPVKEQKKSILPKKNIIKRSK
jgi:hypothetical protein